MLAGRCADDVVRGRLAVGGGGWIGGMIRRGGGSGRGGAGGRDGVARGQPRQVVVECAAVRADGAMPDAVVVVAGDLEAAALAGQHLQPVVAAVEDVVGEGYVF